jgi:hypothetical protein
MPHLYRISKEIINYQTIGLNKTLKSELEKQTEENIAEKINSTIINDYKNKIKISLEIIDNKKSHQILLFNCIEEMFKTFQKIYNLKMPLIFTNSLTEFEKHIKKFIVEKTWKRCIKEISIMHLDENWKIISENLSITNTPLKFFDYLKNTINYLSIINFL